MHLWHQPNALCQALPCLPTFQFQPAPAPFGTFFQSAPNRPDWGLFNLDGSGKSATCDHHVDNNAGPCSRACLSWCSCQCLGPAPAPQSLGPSQSPLDFRRMSRNCLRFIVLSSKLSLASSVWRLITPSLSWHPILLALADNMASKSRIHRVIASSSRRQASTQICAALLHLLSLWLQCNHVAGVLSADVLESTKTAILQLFPDEWSRLFSASPLGLPKLPNNLG